MEDFVEDTDYVPYVPLSKRQKQTHQTTAQPHTDNPIKEGAIPLIQQQINKKQLSEKEKKIQYEKDILAAQQVNKKSLKSVKEIAKNTGTNN